MQIKPEHWYCGFRTKEIDSEKLNEIFEQVLLDAKITIVGSHVCNYEGGGDGFTLIFFLGESHLAITVYPECGETFIELSCCNQEMFDNFVAIVRSRNLGYGLVFSKV